MYFVFDQRRTSNYRKHPTKLKKERTPVNVIVNWTYSLILLFQEKINKVSIWQTETSRFFNHKGSSKMSKASYKDAARPHNQVRWVSFFKHELEIKYFSILYNNEI